LQRLRHVSVGNVAPAASLLHLGQCFVGVGDLCDADAQFVDGLPRGPDPDGFRKIPGRCQRGTRYLHGTRRWTIARRARRWWTIARWMRRWRMIARRARRRTKTAWALCEYHHRAQ